MNPVDCPHACKHRFHTAAVAAAAAVGLLPRPPNAQEIAERAPQVIQCNETLREVTLYQNMNGKQMSRTFRYDKVQPVAE